MIDPCPNSPERVYTQDDLAPQISRECLLELEREGKLFVQWPLVRSCGVREVGLYGLGVPAILTDTGLVRCDQDWRMNYVQRGLAPSFDIMIVRCAIEALEANHLLTLGTSVSLASLQALEDWQSIIERLAKQRDCAVRLTIEIDFDLGGATLPSIASLIQSLRGAGCRIAFSGWGGNQLAPGQLSAFLPDNVRILPAYAQRAQQDERYQTVLHHLVTLADRLIGKHASIVDGIENKAMADLAHSVGSGWMAGRYCSAISHPKPLGLEVKNY